MIFGTGDVEGSIESLNEPEKASFVERYLSGDLMRNLDQRINAFITRNPNYRPNRDPNQGVKDAIAAMNPQKRESFANKIREAIPDVTTAEIDLIINRYIQQTDDPVQNIDPDRLTKEAIRRLNNKE